MKKTKIISTLALGFLFSLFAGCTGWLGIDPYDKTLDKEVYASEVELQAAHNGLYITLGKNSLYGFNLTGGAVGLLAQQYAVNEAARNNFPEKFYISRYNYEEKEVKAVFDEIWKEAYSAILGINYFIARLSATEGLVSPANKNLLLGEAYALRAYIHFDMLRLYGPIYSTAPDAESIPYYTSPIVEKGKRLPAKVVVNKVLADIEIALDYLDKDPIISNGLGYGGSAGESDYYYQSYRNWRMNYYAVTALKARLLLYAGMKLEASEVVSSMLPSVSAIFGWTEPGEVILSGKEDRVFSKEVMFGVNVSTMYSNWTTYFSGDIADLNALYCTTQFNLRNAFEVTDMSLSNDLRARSWVEYNVNTEMRYSKKFAKTTEDMIFNYFQPLIRKSELYYILAECNGSISPLNTVKEKRGTAAASTDLNKLLELEHTREFFGEGQLFYFYKRRNYDRIVSGQSTGSANYVTMTKENYMPPIPERELNN